MRNFNSVVVPLLVATVLSVPAYADEAKDRHQETSADKVLVEFKEPPQSARPRVWWHWMNGNVTKDGIAKDLEWMKRVGIGGLQNFDANLATPLIVQKRLVYMHPDWKDAFHFAAQKADDLGLELAIASSPGWSETGGPWVQAQDGLKKVVWSETQLVGGSRFTGKLLAPPSVTGPFQGIPFKDPLIALSGEQEKTPPKYYRDIAVLAYPVQVHALPRPIVRGADGKVLDASALLDEDLATTVQLPGATADKPPMLTLEYSAPVTIRSARLFVPGAKAMFSGAGFAPQLESSTDGGRSWNHIADFPVTAVPTTISFAPATARLFRVLIVPQASAMSNMGETAPGIDPGPFAGYMTALSGSNAPQVAEIKLFPEAKVDQAESKAGFALERDYYDLSRGIPDEVGVPVGQVIDVTRRMKPDGTLDWTPPEGNWRVVRLGYSLLGTTNHPAPAEATGLEVDKFDGAAVRSYLETYIGMYRDAAGADLIGKRGVRAILTDSIEVGAANWTPKMIAQFKRLRGYDPVPWLPVLTGSIIGSRSESDKFLYDFRRTLAELMASEHYGTVAQVAHEHDLKVYGEALEDNRPSLGDDMAMRSHADVPMSALWTFTREKGPNPTYLADMKGAASVAHLYGQNLVAAESMTAAMNPWAYGPADLRRIIDLEFVTGINRPVIHTSVHQPVDDKVPGLSLFIFGQYFNRHESWAEMAKPWVDYISRNSFLLQQGRNFADVAYFYGEESPLTGLYGKTPVQDAPIHYAYDFVNSDALVNLLRVENGDVVAKSGARYRIIYLGGSSAKMTLPMLRRLSELVEAGATVVGREPTGSPSLDDKDSDFRALVAKMWSGQAVTPLGSGRVIASKDVEAVLGSIGVEPDFDYTGEKDSDILFLHRRVEDGDIYFVNNRVNRAANVEARFRVTGKVPEIWRADTGTSEPISYRTEGDHIVVPLSMLPEDSFYVVFRKVSNAAQATLIKPVPSVLTRLDGPWEVAFQNGRGAPPTVTLASLGSLSEQQNPGVKFFSGTSTYTKSFALPKRSRVGSPLWLDLGKIADIAEVRVNGTLVGTVWHAPYRLDIGKVVKQGTNRLEVRVANLWVNRLIGDAQPGAEKITWTAVPTYKADAPLRPSGLIGPVTLEVEK